MPGLTPSASARGACQYRFLNRTVKSFATTLLSVSAKTASRSTSAGRGRWASPETAGSTANRSFQNGTHRSARKRFASAKPAIPSTPHLLDQPVPLAEPFPAPPAARADAGASPASAAAPTGPPPPSSGAPCPGSPATRSAPPGVRSAASARSPGTSESDATSSTRSRTAAGNALFDGRPRSPCTTLSSPSASNRRRSRLNWLRRHLDPRRPGRRREHAICSSPEPCSVTEHRTSPERGHFYCAKDGHFYCGTTGVPATRRAYSGLPAQSGRAQRRPEPGSRQHHRGRSPPLHVTNRSTKAGTGVPATPLASGGRQPGAGHRSTKAGTGVPATHGRSNRSMRRGAAAQRRPEPGSRQHFARRAGGGGDLRRSTKAGTGVPATLGGIMRPIYSSGIAQRRPEPGSRQHVAPAPRPPVGQSTLNEGRNRGPGNTVMGAWGRGGACNSLNEGRNRGPGNTHPQRLVHALFDRSTKAGTGVPATRAGGMRLPPCALGAQRRPEPGSRQHLRTVGMVRAVRGGAQRRPEPGSRQHQPRSSPARPTFARSTKAGTGVPATHGAPSPRRAPAPPLNEGRNRGPGNTGLMRLQSS